MSQRLWVFFPHTDSSWIIPVVEIILSLQTSQIHRNFVDYSVRSLPKGNAGKMAQAVRFCPSLDSTLSKTRDKFGMYCSRQRKHSDVINYLPLEIQMNLNIFNSILIIYSATQFQLEVQHIF